MVVLPSTGASRYHNYCIDGGTSKENFGSTHVLTVVALLHPYTQVSFKTIKNLNISIIFKIMQEYNHTESQFFLPLYVILPFYRVITGFVMLTVVTDVHVCKFYCMHVCKVVCSVLQDLCTGLAFSYT